MILGPVTQFLQAVRLDVYMVHDYIQQLLVIFETHRREAEVRFKVDIMVQADKIAKALELSYVHQCGRLTRQCGRLTRQCGRLTRQCGRLTRQCGRLTRQCGRLTQRPNYQSKTVEEYYRVSILDSGLFKNY